MPNPLTKIVDIETGEELERPMTAAELAQWKADQEAWNASQSAAQAKAEAQASAVSKLAALGLTEEEIAALRG